MWVKPMLANRTKGKALDHVRERLKGFVVPEFILLSCGVWHDDPESLLDAVQHRFGEKTVVVRSSATDEDGEHGARAGEYDSSWCRCRRPWCAERPYRGDSQLRESWQR